jgi:hypothetical protein
MWGDTALAADLVDEIVAEDQVQPAIFSFNQNPRHGVAELCDAFHATSSPVDIAHLFLVVPGLLSRQVGAFLSRPENEPILRAYFLELDIRLPYLLALRRALSLGFQLPAEGELIDHVVHVWAKVWVESYPSPNMDSEEAYILAFATVLLNSDLHNSNCKRKMSESDFILNIRGACSAERIPDFRLHEIYSAVKLDPIIFKGNDGAEFLALTAPKLKGNIRKKSGTFFSFWTGHYFVLTNSCLYYFTDDSQVSADRPKGMVQLVGVTVRPVGSRKIEIAATAGCVQYVKFRKRRPEMVRGVEKIFFRMQSTKSRDKWLYRIRTSCVYSNFTGENGPPTPRELQLDAPDEQSASSGDENGNTPGIMQMQLELLEPWAEVFGGPTQPDPAERDPFPIVCPPPLGMRFDSVHV